MKKEILTVIIILLVASVFRFQKITSVPVTFPEEIQSQATAVNALSEGLKVFYPGKGQESLYTDLSAVSIKFFSKYPWAPRAVSAIAGLLTVLGLFFLGRSLFDWRIGAIASYLLGISFWHVLFSRLGLSEILAPLFAVWCLYFFWRGLSTARLVNFGISAIFFGAGFYSSTVFWAMLPVLIITIIAYRSAIIKDFSHEKYVYTNSRILRGLALFLVIGLLVVLPIYFAFFAKPSELFLKGHFVFSPGNIGNTFAMFNFKGDANPYHNIPGQPLLIWPISALFAIGFIRSWIKLFKTRKKHGHFSTLQAMLLSWFIVGALASAFSDTLPNAMKLLLISPTVFIFAAEGLWWIFSIISGWYHQRDVHQLKIHRRLIPESLIAATIAVLILLGSFTAVEYQKYFTKWAQNPDIINPK